jgi:hypothetical protein
VTTILHEGFASVLVDFILRHIFVKHSCYVENALRVSFKGSCALVHRLGISRGLQWFILSAQTVTLVSLQTYHENRLLILVNQRLQSAKHVNLIPIHL